MNPTAKNVLAVVVGIVVGSAVNMGLIVIGMKLIPPPAGMDVTDIESIKANMHLHETKHFVVPFLAHALGTLAGAFTAARLAASHRFPLALGISVFFLAGGIYMAVSLPAPVAFEALDLIAAYLPMGWLGHKLATSRSTPAA